MGKYIPHSYSGRADNLVFVHTARGTYMRSRPSKFPHTTGTKTAAAIFGQASSIGATLRSGLLPGLSLESYNGFQNRLTTAIAAWLRSHPAPGEIKPVEKIQELLEVAYNEKGRTIDSLWKIKRIVSIAEPGILEIIFPVFNPLKNLSVAPHTTAVSFSMAAVSCGLNAKHHGQAAVEFSFDYTDQNIEERIIRLELAMPVGSLLVVAASLKCMAPRYNRLAQISPKIYGPASIISAMYQ